MGRVRRYRKIKTCDPFSKRKATGNGKVYDDPPEIFEAKARNRQKRLEAIFEDPDMLDRQNTKQARREIAANKDKEIKTNMPAQNEGESLKAYSKRLKAETRKTLIEEVSKLNSSAIRRKEKMKLLKEKRKNKGKKEEDFDALEFLSREDGHIRPSDRGDVKPEFPQEETPGLWDFVTKPPELQKWASQLKKPKKEGPKMAMSGLRMTSMVGEGLTLRESRSLGAF